MFAFWDCSGAYDDRLLLVGGIIIATESVPELTRCWIQTSEKFGIEYSQMRQFRNYSSGVFKHLNKTERHKYLNEQLANLKKHIEMPFIVSLHPHDFNQLVPSSFKSKWGTAYTICTQNCIQSAADWVRGKGFNEYIVHVLEAGDRNQEQAKQHLERVLINRRLSAQYLFHSYEVRDGSDPLLQAADLIAHEAYYANKEKNLDIIAPEMIVNGANISMRGIWAHCDRRYILRILDLIEKLKKENRFTRAALKRP